MMIERDIRLNISSVRQLLEYYSPLFAPPLSQGIDLEKYTIKLSEHAHFLLSRESDFVNGFIAYYLNQEIRQIYIPLLAVDTSMRGKGLAHDMMEGIKSVARDNAFTSIALEVNKDNVRAVNYYFRQGFKIKENRETKYLMCMLL